MWDGKVQALFPDFLDVRSVIYKDKSFELHMNTMGWEISDSLLKYGKVTLEIQLYSKHHRKKLRQIILVITRIKVRK